MRLGVVIPQGWTGEYRGWDPLRAWQRSVALARQAESLGFDSAWLFDHFQTIPEPSDDSTFESFTVLAALAAQTSRIRLGHVVVCAGFRNPALVAKMAATLDVISAGRFALGIGAGWKQDEWEAYGYGFPPLADRLASLAESLEVITRMLDRGTPRATYAGRYARVLGAINEPKGVQRPRLPIIVGGNGPQVTWRLAARFADELNLDGPSPREVTRMLPVVRARCDEVGRDPATLPVSVHIWTDDARTPGAARVERLSALRELGIVRATCLIREAVESDEALIALAEDGAAAGVVLDP